MHILIHRDRDYILIWLTICALLVALMVLLGGYTRLSGSGLSIIEWKPIHGVVPPLDESAWQEEFDAYRQSPQYQKINRGMTVEEFKSIFWPEYFHRLLGRTIGALFLLPLLVFAFRRSLSRALTFRLVGIFALGGLQGLIGWLMVRSGLVDDPHVSHLRLALHLSVAFAIVGLLVWTILDVILSEGRQAAVEGSKIPRQARDDKSLYSFITWFLLLCLQIILGAFVAGLRAGLIYNTYPLMDGQFLPDGLLAAEPWHDNIPLIQFLHRNLAVVVAFGFLIWWYFHRRYVSSKRADGLCLGMGAAIAVQFTLGVLTLLHQVPLVLALLHQMTALVLFALAVALLHKLTHDH